MNEKIAVIGGGQMGSQIAALAAMAGYKTNIYDENKENLEYRYKFVEIRCEVIGEITGQDARDNIDKLSQKYWEKPYPFPIQTERIVLVIKPNKEVMFNLKDEDFE